MTNPTTLQNREEFLADHPEYTLSRLNDLIQQRKKYGLADGIEKVGGRIAIRPNFITLVEARDVAIQKRKADNAKKYNYGSASRKVVADILNADREWQMWDRIIRRVWDGNCLV